MGLPAPADDITAASLKKHIVDIHATLKPKAKTDLATRVALEASLRDLSEILSAFQQDPSKISRCLSMSKTAAASPSKALNDTGGASTFFSDKYTTFGRIPKVFLWQLWSNAHPTHLTSAKIELLEQYDGDAVRKLTEFATGRKPSSAVPPACHDKRIMTSSLKSLAASFSRMTDDWLGQAIQADGKIRWAECGVYTLVRREAGPQIKHINGEVKDFVGAPPLLDTHYVKNNWSDGSAVIEFGIVDFKPSKLFGNLRELTWATNAHYAALVAGQSQERQHEGAENMKLSAISEGVASACKRRRRAAPGGSSDFPATTS